MRTVSFSSASGIYDLDKPPTCNVVMAYEDFATGQRALGIYRRMVGELGQRWLFNSHMWKFDFLKFPRLREMAAEEAIHAEVIIISVHGAENLPGEVKAWCEQLLLKKGAVPKALVLLFDPGKETDAKSEETREYLADLAVEIGIDFFCNPTNSEEEDAIRLEHPFFSGRPAVPEHPPRRF
jgi:hypothetical protein